MTEIEIPFLKEFQEDIENGQKIMTTRTKKYGEPGDTFTIGGTKLVLLAVFRIRLWHVAWHFCKAEGFYSPEEFVKVWNKIHARKKYGVTEQSNFWCHIFTPTHEWGDATMTRMKEAPEKARPDACLNCQFMQNLYGQIGGLKLFCQQVCHVMTDYVEKLYGFAADDAESLGRLWATVEIFGLDLPAAEAT